MAYNAYKNYRISLDFEQNDLILHVNGGGNAGPLAISLLWCDITTPPQKLLDIANLGRDICFFITHCCEFEITRTVALLTPSE